MSTTRMRYVQCPCGELLEGDTDDRLVTAVRRHLQLVHPTVDYHRDQILSMAY